MKKPVSEDVTSSTVIQAEITKADRAIYIHIYPGKWLVREIRD